MPRKTRGSASWFVAVVVSALVLSACGGSDSDPIDASGDEPGAETQEDGGADTTDGGSDEGASAGSAGTIGGAPPSGQARASVDGLELTFDLPGALACSVSEDALTYSYRIGDNEVTLGAGVNRVEGGWMGSISLNIAEPAAEPGPIAYYPTPGEEGVLDGSLFTVDGNTVMYEGPMLKQPPNDGSQPPPVDIGTGTVIATC